MRFAILIRALSRGGRLTVASTPKGKLNRFYDLWVGENNYEKYEIPWWECSDMTEEKIGEYRDELSTIPGMFEQEYECSFEAYAGALWSMAELEALTVSRVNRGGITCLGYDPAFKHDKSAVVIVQLKNKKKSILN